MKCFKDTGMFCCFFSVQSCVNLLEEIKMLKLTSLHLHVLVFLYFVPRYNMDKKTYYYYQKVKMVKLYVNV